jgi:hypothetical protein
MPDRFTIGDRVQVRAYVSFVYDENGNRVFEREPVETPFVGIVVGRRYRQLGKYHPSSGHTSIDGDYCDPAYLAVSKTVPVWLITTGIRNNPKDVLDDDLTAV